MVSNISGFESTALKQRCKYAEYSSYENRKTSETQQQNVDRISFLSATNSLNTFTKIKFRTTLQVHTYANPVKNKVRIFAVALNTV